MVSALRTVLSRELMLRARRPGDLAQPLLFLVAVTMLFPLAIGPSAETLGNVSAGVLWVAALLSTLLSLDLLFRADFEDGTLEQLSLVPTPLALVVLAKLAAHWIGTALPAVALSPLLALWLGFPHHALPELMLSLALGTPALVAIGAIGSALTLGVDRGGSLLALLVLPLYTPVVIFGAGVADAAAAGLPVAGQLRLLAAGSVLALTLGPLAIAGALRISLD